MGIAALHFSFFQLYSPSPHNMNIFAKKRSACIFNSFPHVKKKSFSFALAWLPSSNETSREGSGIGANGDFISSLCFGDIGRIFEGQEHPIFFSSWAHYMISLRRAGFFAKQRLPKETTGSKSVQELVRGWLFAIVPGERNKIVHGVHQTVVFM